MGAWLCGDGNTGIGNAGVGVEIMKSSSCVCVCKLNVQGMCSVWYTV